MAFTLRDNVEQACPAPTTTNPFVFTTTDALDGFQQWVDVLTDGDTTFYQAKDTAGNWETGLGTWTESGESLARTTVFESNAGVSTAATFSSTVTVGCGLPASRFNTKGTLLDMGETVKAHGAITESTDPGIDLDIDEGHCHTGTIDANCKFNLLNTTAHSYTALTFILTKGANTVTWGNLDGWLGATPDISAAGTYIMFFHFLGADCYGVFGGAVV